MKFSTNEIDSVVAEFVLAKLNEYGCHDYAVGYFTSVLVRLIGELPEDRQIDELFNLLKNM